MLAEQMKLLYIDLEQAESRTVGAIIYRLFGDPDYLDAQESGDPHTLVCSMAWEDLPWPKDFSLSALQRYGKFPRDVVKAARKVADSPSYRDMTYRDLAKRLGHGTNYRGNYKTMAQQCKIQAPIALHFQTSYFDAFPSIPRWHRWVAQQLQVHRQLTTMLGRRRWFFGRLDDDATLREAIAYEPQSVATGDYMNLGLLRVWKKNLPIHLFAQIHDAIALAYDERDEHWIIPEICSTLEIPIELKSPTGSKRTFVIPTEPMVGWNLSYRRDGNPDGLIKWTGEDERKRQSSTSAQITSYNFKEGRFMSA